MKLSILQGLEYSQVSHNNTSSKGFLSPFLDEETDSQKGHMLKFTLLSDGWKQKTDPFAVIFTLFPLCQRFPDWVPRAQGQGETPWPPHCGESEEKKGCLTRRWFRVHFKQSSSAFNFLFTVYS